MTYGRPPAPLVLEDLALGYGHHAALRIPALRLETGALVAVAGPNGGGKSTLLTALAGQLRPLAGRIRGLEGRRTAWLPQHATMDRSFPIRMFDMVAMGLWHEVGALGSLSRAQRRRCEAALEAVGLADHAQRSIGALSGGQFQRALFARLLLQDADLVLLDEPFAAVDGPTTDLLMALLLQWHAAGKTILVVLHDRQRALQHCPQALLLAGEVVDFGPAAQVLGSAPIDGPPRAPAVQAIPPAAPRTPTPAHRLLAGGAWT